MSRVKTAMNQNQFGHERFGITHRFSRSLGHIFGGDAKSVLSGIGRRFGHGHGGGGGGHGGFHSGGRSGYSESRLVVPQVGYVSPYGFYPADWDVDPYYRWNSDFPGAPYDLDLFWTTYAP